MKLITNWTQNILTFTKLESVIARIAKLVKYFCKRIFIFPSQDEAGKDESNDKWKGN